jgi:MinD-like ATPase involved in chromosome partitioning or flagellar assembly
MSGIGPHVVVGGMPGLQRALERTGVFAGVAGRDGTQEIVALLTSTEVQGRTPDQTVFVFADTVTENSPDWPLAQIVRVLSANGYKVIIVAKTAKGRDLAQKHPGVGVLPVPLALNAVLYAMSTFGHLMPTDLPGMFDTIELDGTQPAVPAAGSQPFTGAVFEPVRESNQYSQEAPAEPLPVAPSFPGGGTTDQSAPRPSFGGGWSVPEELAAEAAPATTGSGPSSPAFSGAPAPSSTGPAFGGAPAPSSTGPAFGGAPAPSSTGPAFSGAPAPSSTGPAFSGAPAPTTPRPSAFGGPAGGPAPDTAQRPVAFPGFGAANPGPASPGTGPYSEVVAGADTAWAPVHRQGSSGYYASPTPAARRGWVITVATPKGGAGKSSLTLNLAAYLGMRLRSQGKTVCVIDSNFQQADLGKYLDIYTPNINTIANNPSLLNVDRILEGLVHKSEYNLSALLGPATPDEGNPLNIDANLYNEILDLLKQLYDYILIDTPVAEKYHDMFAKFALPKADYIVVPVAPNYPTLHNADNWLHSAVIAPSHSGGAGVDRARIGILLNRAEDDIGCSVDDVRRTMASWAFIGSIPETKEWKAANNRNELIAPKAYGQLLESFAEVMYAATQEPVLIENLSLLEGKKGLIQRFLRRDR